MLGTAGPRDLVALARSSAVIPQVTEILGDAAAPLIRSLCAELDDLADVRQRIERTLVDEPPALARDGGFTRDGFDPEIDELRVVSRSGRQIIADMEIAERERTGIASLKVRFNRVFGYYIEITKSNLHLAPADYERKQTIAGGERFSTPALRDYETKILGADERILARELDVFEELTRAVAAEASRVQVSARALATLDALAGLAETAVVRNYTKPHVHDGDELVATDVRHPVVEARVAGGFVPNDVDLNGSTRQVVILTGPNMGGKSTYLRQTALLPLLAQMGSFVPARDAKLPLVDRIYARVGASDNIARGQSTFMVEMQETANILHTATSRSLVVLDEIGRGTATFDGLSIAWAVAEYLASQPGGAAEDALRHALSRADRSGRRAARRRQRARGGARVEGRHRLPAQDPPGPRRSQLRDPGGAARRPAAGRDRPREGDPHWPRARRAVARRAPDAPRLRRSHAAARALCRRAGRRPAPAAGRNRPGRLRALDLDDTTPRQALEALAELQQLAAADETLPS